MKICPKCGNEHEKGGKFCSRSCANSRTWSDETNKSRAEKLVGKKRPDVPLSGCYKRHDDILRVCKICGKEEMIRYLDRKSVTCGSDDCVIQAKIWQRSYQNGSRKPVWFFNPFEEKDVLLESSWEVEIAQYLIERDVKWTRPKFIKWVDSSGKTRRYFPDFYLPDFDLYLDPKNPYCMARDKEKMAAVSQLINVVFGSLEMIKEHILRVR